MEKYINKNAVVAEINRVLNSYDPNEITSGRYALADLRDFINTLDVKEVDLEKEIKDYSHALPHAKTGVPNGWRLDWHEDEVMEIAKHFFELGMRVKNTITASDRGTAEEIIINLKRVEQDYHIDLTKEMEWLRSKAQKGE